MHKTINCIKLQKAVRRSLSTLKFLLWRRRITNIALIFMLIEVFLCNATYAALTLRTNLRFDKINKKQDVKEFNASLQHYSPQPSTPLSLDDEGIVKISEIITAKYNDIPRSIVIDRGVLRVGNIKLATISDTDFNCLIHVKEGITEDEIVQSFKRFQKKGEFHGRNIKITRDYHRVLLIGPTTRPERSKFKAIHPRGVYRIQYIVLTERDDADVLVCDPNLYDDSQVEEIISRPFDLVGFSSLVHSLMYDAKLMTKVLKKEWASEALMAIGGMVIAYLDVEEVFRMPVDIAVKGYGESPFLKILDNLAEYKKRKKNRLSVFSGITGVAVKGDKKTYGVMPALYTQELFEKAVWGDIRFVPYSEGQDILCELGYWKTTQKRKGKVGEGLNFTLNILTSMSICTGKCIYCSSMSRFVEGFGREAIRQHNKIFLSPPQIVALIRKAIEEHPETDSVHWSQDTLLANVGYARKSAFALRDADLGITGEIKARPDQVVRNENTLDILHSAGFKKLYIGWESCVQHVLDDMDRGTTVEQNEKALELGLQKGFKVQIYIILFPPTVTKEDVVITMDKAKECVRKGVDVSVMPYMNALPGSRILEEKELYKKYKDYIEWEEVSIGNFGSIKLPGRVNVIDKETNELLNTVLSKFNNAKKAYLENPDYPLNRITYHIARLILFELVYRELGLNDKADDTRDLILGLARKTAENYSVDSRVRLKKDATRSQL